MKNTTLPDGRAITAPDPINIYDPEKFEKLNKLTWHTVKAYLGVMGIKFDTEHISNIIKTPDKPDDALISAIQYAIVHTLETECGINFQKTKPVENEPYNYFGGKIIR